MPSPAPLTSEQCAAQLQALGAQIRAQRKALRLSATVTAEAAGLSRVTLHRIEKGEPSVTMGAWCNAMAALGMGLQATPSTADTAKPAPDRTGWIPARVPLADYPQLRALAWHVPGAEALSPAQAWSLYQRNARHLDAAALTTAEQQLIQALQQAFADDGAPPHSPDGV